MEDSSSETPMEEGSMDGSEQEYEYDIEGDDEDREDEYDEGADDDDDMDDDEDSLAPQSAYDLDGLVNHFRFVNRVDAPPAATADLRFADGPRTALNVLSLDSPGADPVFDRRVMETIDWLTNMDSSSFWNFINTYAVTGPGGTLHFPNAPAIPRPFLSRSGHGPVSAGIMSSDFPFHREAESSHRVHPSLHRPSTPAGSTDPLRSGGEPATLDFLLPGSSLFGPSARGFTSINIELRSNIEHRTADVALDDAVSNLANLTRLISRPDSASTPAQFERSNGPERSEERQPASSSPANPSQQQRSNAEDDEIVPVPQAQPTSAPGSSLGDLAADPSMSVRDANPGLSLAALALPAIGSSQQFLLPSQSAARGDPFGPGMFSAFARRSFGGRMPRERDRTSTGRRWTYDPPGNGGDDLPAMFSGESSNQRSQNSSERRGSSSPFTVVAAESFDSVNKLETKIVDRLATLASDLRKIDSTVKKQVSEAKMRIEKDEKKQVAEVKSKAGKDSSNSKTAGAAKPPKPPEVVVVSPDSSAAPAEGAITNEEMTAEQPEANSNRGMSTPASVEHDDIMQTVENGEQGIAVAADEDDTIVVDDVADDQPSAIEIDIPEDDQPAEDASGAEAGATNPQASAANGEFPSVAAARAAAIGVSLDAPANNDPNVVAAALESTGIDPTFLSALPDGMRSEVFMQLFDRMRTAPAAGVSEQPVTTLSQDFLIALPPEVRAEVLEAEVEYQTRNAPADNPNSGAGNDGGPGTDTTNVGPGEPMDNATFLATLPQELREEVLISLEEDVLQGLPPTLAAEARTLRERDAASRIREHGHGWGGSPDDAPVMFRRDIYNGMTMGRRERESREIRRDVPDMRWEKIGNHWYRVGPKQEDDVKSSLDGEALTAIVQLLRLRQSSFGKTTVYQVLASACKNSKARRQVLIELLTMITGDKEGKAGATEDEISTVFATEGTVVRRALELLAQLCKNDYVVAESLIGLASPPGESKTDEVLPKGCASGPDRLLSLSTLTSLLSSPLFLRSNVHLEQLLVIISFVCRAFPPSRQGSSSKRLKLRNFMGSYLTNILSRFGDDDDDDDDEDDEGRIARREFLGHIEEGLEHGDRELTPDEVAAAESHLMTMESMGVRQTFRRMRRHPRVLSAPDSDDSSDEDRERDEAEPNAATEDGEVNAQEQEEPAGDTENTGDTGGVEDSAAGNTIENEDNTQPEGESEAQAGSAGENNNATKKKKKKPKKEKKPEVRIGVEYRVPKLSEKDLNALVVVLRRPGCTDWVYEQVSTALGQLGELSANRSVTISALANSAQDLGSNVKKAYVTLKNDLELCGKEAKGDAMKRKQAISKFVMSGFSSELMLLRLVKTASTLLNNSSKKEKPAKPSRTSGGDNEQAPKASEPEIDGKVLAELRESKDRVFQSLQDVWVSLYEILDLVESELETPTRDRKKGSSRTGYTPRRRNEGLARQTRTRNSRKSLSPVLARLSPTIEAFFITHSTLIEEDDDTGSVSDKLSSPRPMSPLDWKDSPASTPRPSDSMDIQIGKSKYKELGSFLSKHRVPVNALLRANPSLLETSFKMALKHPQTIDFDNKKAYFRSLIRKRSNSSHASTVRISVRRDHVYNDTFHNLRNKTKDQMKGRLHVQFNGEEGIDAGGVTREWYTILARQIFDPNYALFCRSAAKAATYQPDKRSHINQEHLENFKFVGRMIAKAIYDGQLIDAYFTRSFYKHILSVKPTYRDIEAQDPDYYNSLKWMLENDITGVLDQTMSAEFEEFGQRKIVDLIPNGRNVPVTEDNKTEYVRAMTEVRLTKAIEKQIEAFKEGFHELIPLEDCKIFNELELELVMSGLPDIDMADLKANVEYTGYTSSSPQINWFWRCVSQMDQEDLARLVMFVTGTSKVPLEGFSALQGMNGAQKFQIHRVAGDTNRLPSAHTCFNQLDLPEYGSAELLAERLLKAVRECNVGFGFA